MRLPFTKMQGLGNDFVMFDGVNRPIDLNAQQLRAIADRHFGIGCDQILLVEPPQRPEAQFRYRIFNADGGEVEQCGNGARCFARFVRDLGLTQADVIPVETAAGLIELRIEADGQVTVDMGAPRTAPQAIPFTAEAEAPQYAIEALGERWSLGAVSLGNPHAVLQVADLEQAPVETLGPAIEVHARFPQRVNVGFMQRLDRGHIRLRVFERGSGETLACGSGACAAAVVGQIQGLLDEVVTVSLPGGDLVIEWRGRGTSVMMTGPATHVFEGQIEL